MKKARRRGTKRNNLRRPGVRRTPGAPTPVMPYASLMALLKRASDPLSLPQVLNLAGLESADEPLLRGQMEFLEREGVVFSQRRGRWNLHSRARVVIGRLSCPEGTYGFIVPEEGKHQDLFVSGRGRKGARHGDLVLGRLTGGTEGEVLAILERRAPFAAGIYHGNEREGIVVPRDERLGSAVAVAPQTPGPESTGIENGSVVWVEITAEEGWNKSAQGRILEVMGRPDDPGVDERTVRRIHDLPGPFPEEVERAVRSIPAGLSTEEKSRREDFTVAPVVTVDPATARDHDDAVGLTRLSSPHGDIFRLTVHIADVARYVEEGGVVDAEARKRGTSVYFPGNCLPMLPAALSSDLCSLLPGVERLVQSVVIDFDHQGKRIGSRFADGFIRSVARMTYDELESVLGNENSGASGDGHGQMLREMGALCRLLRSRRMRRGSLDLDLPETEIILDGSGRVVELRPATYGLAHQVIEEFMLAANETVAEYLNKTVRASLYRIHEDPEPAGIDELEERLLTMGTPLRRTRGAPAARLASILSTFRGRPEEPAVTMMVLRTLKLARYSHEAIGHFGLAAPLYTHFTSPIRRYPDLMVHRILRAVRQGGSGARRHKEADADAAEHLAAAALACSRLERRAQDAERAVADWKKAVYMKGHIGEEFEGRVTGATASALYVTLDRLGAEGIIPLSRGAQGHGSQRGGSTRRTGGSPIPWRLGETLRVRVESVDVFRARVMFRALSRA